MYYIKTTFDPEFTDLMMHLKAKYPKRLFNLDGIGDEQTDMSAFSKEFFSTKSTTADVSVDANANVDDMSVIAYTKELPKPFFRLNSYYVLWKKLKQLYGRMKANDIIEKQLTGSIYINDFHGIGAGIQYCHNYSTYDVALMGLPMVKKIVSVPPKHLYSFKSQLEQFVVIASNSTLGATGLADMFIVMAYYVDKILKDGNDAGFNFASEDDIWKYVYENIVSFIYTVNQPARGGLQSPFTNISVFDDNFLDNLVDEYKFDGVTPNRDTVKRLQEMFLDIMNDELRRTPVTFPVVTACFSVDEEGNIQDKDFLKMIAEKNTEFGFINIYCGKTSTLSSCCFRGDENIEVFNNKTGIKEIMDLKSFISLFSNDNCEKKINKEYSILSVNPSTRKKEKTNITGILKKKNEYNKLLKITVDNKSIHVTPDHIFMVKNKKTGEIKEITANEISENKEKYLIPTIQNIEFKEIQNIEVLEYNDIVYDIELEKNHYFATNGIITHNCRLRSDTDNEYFNSFGAGSTKIGCYDKETEVLTNNGWKLFKDVDIDKDNIFTMDKYKNPVYQKATEYHEYDYKGELIHFNNKSVDLLVTPNHRMVLNSKKTDKWFEKKAEEVENNSNVSFPTNNPIENIINENDIQYKIEDIDIETFVKFLGIYLSEGCCDKENNTLNHGNERYRINISQNKKANPEKYNEIKEMLEKTPYTWYAFDNGFETNNKSLCIYLRNLGSRYDKFIPKEIKEMPVKYLSILWEWLIKGDGCTSKNGVEMYWTTSKKLKDDIQHILALMGYRSISAVQDKKDSYIGDRLIEAKNQKDCWKIVKYKRNNESVERRQINRVYYHGKVYCLSVPNTTLLVRRNGKISWSGNSLGVATVNLPRIAYKNIRDENEFFEELKDMVIDCQSINNAKRNIVVKRVENGNYPLVSHGFIDIKKQYSTVGINGLYEALEIMGYNILNEDGKEFALKIINTINEVNDRLQKQYQAPHNVEQIPAENVSIKLADKDRLLKYNNKYEIYSNQFIPLITEANLMDRIELQGIFDKYFSGGAIAHLNVEQKIDDPKKLEDLIVDTAKKGVIYFAINYLLRRCENGHMTVGNGRDDCPVCKGTITNTYTRVVGFLTDTNNWHKVRRSVDLPNRQWY